MIHSAKPDKMAQKLLAERCLEPGEVLVLGSPTSVMILFVAQLAKHTPGLLTVTHLNAATNKVPPFSSQSKMLTTPGGWCFAKRTVSLVYHGKGISCYPYLANPQIRQAKA
jgi:hypothetical protein